MIGETASFTSDWPVSSAILPLMYEVPTPPTGPAASALPTIRGMLALNCTRLVIPTDASTMGKSTSLRSAPDHRIADTESDIVPGASRLASSTHESGDALELPGRGLLLGGLLFFPLPWAYVGGARASASTALAITNVSGREAAITERHPWSW